MVFSLFFCFTFPSFFRFVFSSFLDWFFKYFSILFRPKIEKTSIQKVIFFFWSLSSPSLVDFGYHFGVPTLRHSLFWASWAALWRCLALSWAILRDLLRFFDPLGSIFRRFCSSRLHFGTIFDQIWLPFSDLGVPFSIILRSFVVRSFFFVVFVFVFCCFFFRLFVRLFVSFSFVRLLGCCFVSLARRTARSD